MSPSKSERRTSGDRSVARIVREFDYPRESVFRMFTDPNRAAKWFGTPDGAEAVLFELDARPGGTIRIHDREPGGPVHRTTGTVLEIVEPERFVFRSVTGLDGGGAPFEALQSVTLEAIAPKKTRMTVIVEVRSVGAFPGGIASLVGGFEEGWAQTLNKLQRELGSSLSDPPRASP